MSENACRHESRTWVAIGGGGFYMECLDCRARGPERETQGESKAAFFVAAKSGKLDVTSWFDYYAELLLGEEEEWEETEEWKQEGGIR